VNFLQINITLKFLFPIHILASCLSQGETQMYPHISHRQNVNAPDRSVAPARTRRQQSEDLQAKKCVASIGFSEEEKHSRRAAKVLQQGSPIGGQGKVFFPPEGLAPV